MAPVNLGPLLKEAQDLPTEESYDPPAFNGPSIGEEREPSEDGGLKNNQFAVDALLLRGILKEAQDLPTEELRDPPAFDGPSNGEEREPSEDGDFENNQLVVDAILLIAAQPRQNPDTNPLSGLPVDCDVDAVVPAEKSDLDVLSPSCSFYEKHFRSFFTKD